MVHPRRLIILSFLSIPDGTTLGSGTLCTFLYCLLDSLSISFTLAANLFLLSRSSPCELRQVFKLDCTLASVSWTFCSMLSSLEHMEDVACFMVSSTLGSKYSIMHSVRAIFTSPHSRTIGQLLVQWLHSPHWLLVQVFP